MFNEQIISVVAVAATTHREIVNKYLDELHETLRSQFKFYEITLVLNCLPSEKLIDHISTKIKHIPSLRLIQLSRKFDHQIALTCAVESSLGDFTVVMDINSSPIPEILPMVRLCADQTDVVIGKHVGQSHKGLVDRIFGYTYFRITKAITGYDVDIYSSDFCCLSRRAINALTKIQSRSRYFRYLRLEIGYEVSDHTYQPITRSETNLEKGISEKLMLALAILTSSSDRLLRIVNFSCFLIALANVSYAIFIVISYFIKNNTVVGFSSISVVLSMMFACLFFVLSIMGEYLAHIFSEVKNSPLYHVFEERTNSEGIFVDKIRENVVNS